MQHELFDSSPFAVDLSSVLSLGRSSFDLILESNDFKSILINVSKSVQDQILECFFLGLRGKDVDLVVRCWVEELSMEAVRRGVTIERVAP